MPKRVCKVGYTHWRGPVDSFPAPGISNEKGREKIPALCFSRSDHPRNATMKWILALNNVPVAAQRCYRIFMNAKITLTTIATFGT
jgi:hypothetical protein